MKLIALGHWPRHWKTCMLAETGWLQRDCVEHVWEFHAKKAPELRRAHFVESDLLGKSHAKKLVISFQLFWGPFQRARYAMHRWVQSIVDGCCLQTTCGRKASALSRKEFLRRWRQGFSKCGHIFFKTSLRKSGLKRQEPCSRFFRHCTVPWFLYFTKLWSRQIWFLVLRCESLS